MIVLMRNNSQKEEFVLLTDLSLLTAAYQILSLTSMITLISSARSHRIVEETSDFVVHAGVDISGIPFSAVQGNITGAAALFSNVIIPTQEGLA